MIRRIGIVVCIVFLALAVRADDEVSILLEGLSGDDARTIENQLLEKGDGALEKLAMARMAADPVVQGRVDRIASILASQRLLRQSRKAGRFESWFSDTWLLLTSDDEACGYFHYQVVRPEGGGVELHFKGHSQPIDGREQQLLTSWFRFDADLRLSALEATMEVREGHDVRGRQTVKAHRTGFSKGKADFEWQRGQEDPEARRISVNAIPAPLIPILFELTEAAKPVIEASWRILDVWTGQCGEEFTLERNPPSSDDSKVRLAEYRIRATENWTAMLNENGRFRHIDSALGRLTPSTAQICEKLAKE